MSAGHAPVDPWRIDDLVAAAGDLTRQAGEKRQRGIDLRIRQRAAGSLETGSVRSAIDGGKNAGSLVVEIVGKFRRC